eukprot:5672480-Alexandrium_andersonii.AAC.1
MPRLERRASVNGLNLWRRWDRLRADRRAGALAVRRHRKARRRRLGPGHRTDRLRGHAQARRAAGASWASRRPKRGATDWPAAATAGGALLEPARPTGSSAATSDLARASESSGSRAAATPGEGPDWP